MSVKRAEAFLSLTIKMMAFLCIQDSTKKILLHNAIVCDEKNTLIYCSREDLDLNLDLIIFSMYSH